MFDGASQEEARRYFEKKTRPAIDKNGLLLRAVAISESFTPTRGPVFS